MSIERDPGVYANDGSAAALIEQQRAEILKALRTSKAHSVTIMEPSHDTMHNAVYVLDDEPLPFISFVAVKAVRDLAALLDGDHEKALGIVQAAIDNGIGA